MRPDVSAVMAAFLSRRVGLSGCPEALPANRRVTYAVVHVDTSINSSDLTRRNSRPSTLNCTSIPSWKSRRFSQWYVYLRIEAWELKLPRSDQDRMLIAPVVSRNHRSCSRCPHCWWRHYRLRTNWIRSIYRRWCHCRIIGTLFCHAIAASQAHTTHPLALTSFNAYTLIFASRIPPNTYDS